MSKKRSADSKDEGTTADALLDEEKAMPSPAPKKSEPKVSLAEMLAMKKVPDHHAHALSVYVGDAGEKPLSEWMSLYEEFMKKPTGMSKEEWHAEFIKAR